jgi:hypothetical protein
MSMSSAPLTSSTTPLPTSATAAVDGSGPPPESSFSSPSDPRTGGPSNLNRPYFPPQNFARSPPPSSTPSSTPAPMETERTATESSTATSSGPYGPTGTGRSFPALLPPYPRVIKLQERRISTEGTPRAQCTQVEIQGPDQEARPVRGPDGKPVVIEIEETDPFMASGSSDSSEVDDVSRRAPQDWDQAMGGVFGRDGPGGGGPPDISPCGCMWFLT